MSAEWDFLDRALRSHTQLPSLDDLPPDLVAWLDVPDTRRREIAQVVIAAGPDPRTMSDVLRRVRVAEPWEAGLYGIMIERVRLAVKIAKLEAAH